MKPVYSSPEEHLNQLHNRYLARLLTRLEEINIPTIALEAVKIQLSQYTTDVKKSILVHINNDHNQKK